MSDVSISQFVSEIKELAQLFEEDWLQKHAENPEAYPLSLPEDNAGLWYEFFQEFGLSDQIDG